MRDSPLTVASIDIGGARKGCHLVVLRGSAIVSNIRSGDPDHLARMWEGLGAVAVGIDSPLPVGATAIGRHDATGPPQCSLLWRCMTSSG